MEALFVFPDDDPAVLNEMLAAVGITREVLIGLEIEEILAEVALADSIAWQIAKDDGLDGVTLEVWERALFLAGQHTENKHFDRMAEREYA